MKQLTVGLCALIIPALVTSIILKKKSASIEKLCHDESGYQEEVEILDLEDPNYPRDAKRYTACTYKELNEFNEDGTFNLEAMKNGLTGTKEELEVKEKIINECNDEVIPEDKEQYQSSFQFDMCLVKKIRTYYNDRKIWSGATCRKELGYNGRNITELDFDDPDYPKEAKCVLGCKYEKENELNEDGTYNVEGVKALLPFFGSTLLAVEGIIDECYNEVTPVIDDHCESAYQFDKCLAITVKKIPGITYTPKE